MVLTVSFVICLVGGLTLNPATDGGAFFQASVGRGNAILNCAMQPLATGPGSD
jgi:hypothetical protein